jgi:hypothetical protein
MADRKISDLTALTTPASGDYLPIVDISEAAAASKNKRITIEELMRGVPDGTAAAPGIAFETDPNTGIYRPGADQLAVATNGTGRLFIDASGRVGVGTASPVARLQSSVTDGTISIASAGTTKALRIIHDSTTTGIEGVDTTLSASYQPLAIGGSYLIFATEGAERLRITSAGLVGIGNSAPLSKLDVQTAVDGVATIARFYNLSNVSAATQSAIDLQADQSTSRISNLRDGTGTFGTTIISNTAAGVMGERLRITSAGLVGIGTTSPTSRLFVNGSSAASNLIVNAGTTAFSVYNDEVAGEVRLGAIDTSATNAKLLSFYTNPSGSSTGTERARIDSSGRLLIGTSTSTSIGTRESLLQLSSTELASSLISVLNVRADQYGPAIALAKSRGGGSPAVQVNDLLGTIIFSGHDSTDLNTAGAYIQASVDGAVSTDDLPTRLTFSTTADGASSPTERLRITSAGVLQIADAGNITVGTTTGTKIGTATTQKLGFYNATPVVQPTAVADATDAATAITQLNDLLAKLRTLGIIAT